MNKTLISILVCAAVAAAFSNKAFAQTAIAIHDASDITNNSTQDADGTAWLNPGAYTANNTADYSDPTFTGNTGVGQGVTFSATGANRIGYLQSGADAAFYARDGGTVTATGNNGIGIHLIDGSVTWNQDGGTVTATGENSGTGIRLESDTTTWNQHGGTVTASGDNDGIGIHLYGGTATSAIMWNQHGGTVTATGTGGTGIRLYGPIATSAIMWNQHGGMVTATGDNNGTGILLIGPTATWNQHDGTMTASGDNNGRGIHLIGGTATWNQHGGTVTASGDNDGIGIHLYGGTATWNQHGGTVTATGENSGIGIHLDGSTAATWQQHGGTVTATGNNGGTGIGIGLYGGTATWSQDGGTVTATGNNGGMGIHLESDTTTWQQHGGTVTATGNNGSMGIHLDGDTATWNQHGGTLILRPGTGEAVRVDGRTSSSALFASGATLSPVLDAASGAVGKMAVTGNSATATIDPGALLRPTLANSLALAKGSSLSGAFLEADSGITGAFTPGGNSLTLAYAYDHSNPVSHTIMVTRTGYVSDFTASGANRNLALALEANSAWLLSKEGQAYNDFYTDLDSVTRREELDSKLRKANQTGATRLARQTISMTDRGQKQLFSGMTGVNGGGLKTASAHEPVILASADPAYTLGRGESAGRTIWLTPVVSWDTYKGSGSHETTDGHTVGLSGGIAGNIDAGTIGLGITYLYGKQQGSDYQAETDNFSLMAGYISAPFQAAGPFRPRLEAAAGYTYSKADQRRQDFTGARQTSSTDIHSARVYLGLSQTVLSGNGALTLTPRLGADYTHVRIGSIDEGAGGLHMSGKNINSIRPKLGSDLHYAVTDRLGITASAYIRYEALDNNLNLDTRLNGTPIVWVTADERHGRTSGEVGLGLTYRHSDTFHIHGRYDLNIGEGYNSHQASVNLNWRF